MKTERHTVERSHEGGNRGRTSAKHCGHHRKLEAAGRALPQGVRLPAPWSHTGGLQT